MIAVMGAAGHVGGQVAELLLRRHEAVRVLEHRRTLDGLRREGAQVIRGDAADVEALRRLFAGAASALVLLPEDLADPSFVETRSRIARTVPEAIRAEGVRYVVALSAVGADRPDAAGPPVGLRELERGLSALPGANVLLLRSALYMDYLLANLPLIRSQRINGSAIRGDLRFPMIATADVAAEAAERLARCDFEAVGAKLLFGPEDVSMAEATAALGARLGLMELPYVQFPPEELTGALIGAGMSRQAASLIVEMQLALNEGRPFGRVRRTPDSTARTTLETFLARALPGEGATTFMEERP
jgi:uncharacterized protein YbjT (DUF2867 family)